MQGAFSATAEAYTPTLSYFLSLLIRISAEFRVSVTGFSDSHYTCVVTFSLTIFLPKSAPIGTPLRHIFVVTAFLLRKTQLQIGNGPQIRHLSRYLTDLCVFNVIFSLLASSPSFPSGFLIDI